MQVTDIVSMVANVGFPVTLCYILIKYVLQNVDNKLNKMDASLHTLAEEIHTLESSCEEERSTTSSPMKK